MIPQRNPGAFQTTAPAPEKDKSIQLAHPSCGKQLAYIAKVSGPDAARQNLIQTYVLSWSAPPDLATVLTKEELYQEATKHLKEDIKKLLHNLVECDVKAVPCSKAELFNMLHTHYHPITGNRFRYDDLLDPIGQPDHAVPGGHGFRGILYGRTD